MRQLKRLASTVINKARALDTRVRGPFGRRTGVCYVVPDVNWAADVVGAYVTRAIARFGPLPARTVARVEIGSCCKQILHFGTVGDFSAAYASPILARNRVVVTVFHGDRDGDNAPLAQSLDRLLGSLSKVSRVVTGCRIMEERLIRWGVPPDKVVRVPLGVDLDLFRPPPSEAHRESLRRRFDIPKDAFCVGSFQKDGNGWGEGLEPKLIKGPDVFVETLARLSPSHRLFVLLTGPARGYVKRRLDALGIPYHHAFLPDYAGVVDFYHALDAYLMTSREDGAPAALLESFASGTPLVATLVGMVPDITTDGVDAYTAESEDIQTLANKLEHLITNRGLARTMAEAGLKTIAPFGWDDVAKQYLERVYRPLAS